MLAQRRCQRDADRAAGLLWQAVVLGGGSAGVCRSPTVVGAVGAQGRQCWARGMPTLRKGTIPSLEMACRRRGAPVRLCRPAPQVEKKEPMTMTHGDGHARVPTTRFPLTASPNLRGTNITCGSVLWLSPKSASAAVTQPSPLGRSATEGHHWGRGGCMKGPGKDPAAAADSPPPPTGG